MTFPTQMFASWDFGIFFLLWAMGFFWSISQGTRMLKNMIVAMYISMAIIPAISLTQLLRSVGGATLLGHGVSVIIIFGVISFILTRTIRPEYSRAWWKGFFLSAIVAGFFVFFLLQQIPVSLVNPSTLVSMLTKGMWQEIFWVVVPLVGMMLF